MEGMMLLMSRRSMHKVAWTSAMRRLGILGESYNNLMCLFCCSFPGLEHFPVVIYRQYNVSMMQNLLKQMKHLRDN